MASMDQQSCQRLASAISALIARFKIGAENSSYEQLTLTDAAVVSSLQQAEEGEIETIQKDVAQALGLPKTTMTSAVKRLISRGILEQSSGARDARARTLHLTAAGRKLASQLEDARMRASLEILQCLPSPDQAQLIDLLERVVDQSPDKVRRV